MPRYYYNVSGDGLEIFDDIGVELSNPNEALVHLKAIAQLWIEQEENWKAQWVLEARDDEENIVGSMTFGIKPDH